MEVLKRKFRFFLLVLAHFSCMIGIFENVVKYSKFVRSCFQPGPVVSGSAGFLFSF